MRRVIYGNLMYFDVICELQDPGPGPSSYRRNSTAGTNSSDHHMPVKLRPGRRVGSPSVSH